MLGSLIYFICAITIYQTYGRAQQGDRTAEDGGRQNEVLLRTLKRTRLAQRVQVWI